VKGLIIFTEGEVNGAWDKTDDTPLNSAGGLIMKKKLCALLLILLICVSCSSKKTPDTTDDNYRVFYQIFVGSFSDSNGDGIGDLRGIINRIDYLNDGNVDSKSSLGVQGIWLTPIFKAPSYHKYDASDYYVIDPAFGTQDDLDELIRLCHERNMLVILDLAINHTAGDHEWFKQFTMAHQNNDTENKYYDYYVYALKDEKPVNRSFCDLNGTAETYECNFSYTMPELNFDNQDVRNEVLDIAAYYLAKGVDGFRFDAAKYVYLNNNPASTDFWKWYSNELRKIKKDIYLVGEVWSGDGETDLYVKEMNCFNFTVSGADGLIAKAVAGGNADTYAKYVVTYQDKIRKLNPDAMPIYFIANHDMDRAAGYLAVINGRAYIGANLYLLAPGSPFVYYGEEIGMKGARGSANTDANRRLAMLWGDGDSVKDPEGTTYDTANQINGTVSDQLQDKNSLLQHYMHLIRIRKNYPQIARGTYTQLNLENKNACGFAIEYEEETTYLIHNVSNTELIIKTDMFKEILEQAGLNESSYTKGELKIGPYTSVILK